MNKGPLLFALAGLLVVGMAVGVFVAAEHPDPVPSEVSDPARPTTAEPAAAEAPMSRALPAESPYRRADLLQRIAKLEARVAELERARNSKAVEEQASEEEMLAKLADMKAKMIESRINRNLEKAARKLAELKSERKSRVESGQRAASGHWKRKYGYSDEQAEKIGAPLTDYLDKRADAVKALLEGYLSTGGRGDLSSERATLEALDAELMGVLDANFEPHLAITLLNNAKRLIRPPSFLRRTQQDPLKDLDELFPK